MNLQDILVHIDNSKSCAARLDLALQLARQHSAHLTGIYVAPELPYFSKPGSAAETAHKAAQRLFETKAVQAEIANEWVCVDSIASGLGLIEAINLHAHYHDLVILGQNDPESGQLSLTDLPKRAVLGAGRPVLINPYAGGFESVGKRVLLAWRGGPESARAVNDAMPLLQKAHEVRVVSVKTPDVDSEFEFFGKVLSRHLARHGIDARVELIEPAGLVVGDMLLNRAADYGSDLLVMGAFAQIRRGIPGLGDVGRHLLKCMTIPVLMSH